MRDAPAPTVQPEKRLATFVKCDLVDSTLLCTQLPLEDQGSLFRAFRDVVGSVVRAQSGHVMRYEGDAALLSFGHPEAREDATECAVRAGLALVTAVAAIRVVPGVTLQVRVGIATGEVAVGDFIGEGDRVEYAVDGPVPAMAERLRAASHPGQVVVSEATRRLCGRFFDYRDLGVVAAKGFGSGLPAWLVVGGTAVESSFEARRHDDGGGTIVGREHERRQLAGAWCQALAGHGSIVVVTGEPGIGKSRLSHEALQAALNDGATVLRIDCMPRTSRTPYYPIAVLLSRLADASAAAADDDRNAAASRLLEGTLGAVAAREAWPFVAPLFGVSQVDLPEGLMPNEVRDRTVAAIVGLVQAAATKQPVFILCEDLHWADATTLLVLEQVAQRVARMRCLLLVTSRSLAEDRLRWLAASPQIDLPPLTQAEADRLVRLVNPTVDEALVPVIVARAGGTPLWVIEFAAEVGRAGHPLPIDSVPTSLKLVVQSRLERWPEFKSIVQAASVLGREFPIELLKRLLRPRADEVLPTLQLLSQHGFFRRLDDAPAERAEFRHAMIRDAIYDALMRDDRRRWHSSAADELAQMDVASVDAAGEARAYHLVGAQRFDEAAVLHLSTAAEAAERGAFVEAIGHCDEGVRLLADLQASAARSDTQVALLVQRAVALVAQHGFGAQVVEQAYEFAATRVRAGTRDALRYAISRGRTGVRLLRGNLRGAHEFSAEGLAIARHSGSPAQILDALSLRLYTTLYAGTLDECWGLVDDFMVLYDAADGDRLRYPAPQNAKTSMLTLMPTVAWLRGDPVTAERAVQDGLAHVGTLRRPYDQAMLHAWLAGTRCTQRRFAEAVQHAATAIGIAEPRGYRDWIDSARLLGLLAQMMLTPSAELVGIARQACRQLDTAGIGLNASWYRWVIALACDVMRDHEQALALVGEAHDRADASHEQRMKAELLLLQARCPRDTAQGAALLGEAIVCASALGDVTTALRAVAAKAAAKPTGAGARSGWALEALRRLHDADAAVDPGWIHSSFILLTKADGTSGSPDASPAPGPGSPPAPVPGSAPGSLRALEAANFQGDPGAGGGVVNDGGQATYTGDVFTLLLPRSTVAKVLPQGFNLAPPTATARTDHPVVVLLGLQDDCQLVNGGVPTAVNLKYNELIVLVPFVVATGSTKWHNFSVGMYLDELNPVHLGNGLFGLNKVLAGFTATGVLGFPGVEVRHASTVAFTSAIQTILPFEPAAQAVAAFDDFMALMRMPVLGVLPQGLPLRHCCYFEWQADAQTQVAPISSSFVRFTQDLRPPAMADWIQQTTNWAQTDPQSSFSVRKIRWRLAALPPACVF